MGNCGQYFSQTMSQIAENNGLIAQEMMSTFSKNAEVLAGVRNFEDACQAQKQMMANNSLMVWNAGKQRLKPAMLFLSKRVDGSKKLWGVRQNLKKLAGLPPKKPNDFLKQRF